LDPAIHVEPRVLVDDVDAWDKPGHDGVERAAHHNADWVMGPDSGAMAFAGTTERP